MPSGLGSLAGVGAAGEQLLLWDVLGAIINAVLGPELTLLTREGNKLLPATPLSPDALADMVVRNIVALSDATSYARESGIADSDFERMVHSAGEGPSPEELVTALRRNIIPHDGTGPTSVSFQQGIFEGASKDKWWTYYAKLADYIPPPRTVTALVRDGSMTDEEATKLFEAAGLSPELTATYLKDAHRQSAASHKATIATELRSVSRK